MAEDESDGHPEWMELMRPAGIMERSEEFTYDDDDGIDHDGTRTTLEYPSFGDAFVDILNERIFQVQ